MCRNKENCYRDGNDVKLQIPGISVEAALGTAGVHGFAKAVGNLQWWKSYWDCKSTINV